MNQTSTKIQRLIFSFGPVQMNQSTGVKTFLFCTKYSRNLDICSNENITDCFFNIYRTV